MYKSLSEQYKQSNFKLKGFDMKKFIAVWSKAGADDLVECKTFEAKRLCDAIALASAHAAKKPGLKAYAVRPAKRCCGQTRWAAE